jgi:hypothetical protein
MLIDVAIDVAIDYTANGRKSGNSINSTVTFHEIVEIGVTAVSDDDAPIAAEWNDEPPEGFNSKAIWSVADGAERQHVRYHDGAYWRPIQTVSALGQGDGTPVGVNDFLVAAQEGSLLSGFPAPEKRGSKLGSDTAYFERVSASNRRIALADIREAARNVLFVDGVVYERCLEPMVAIVAGTVTRATAHCVASHHHAAALRIITGPCFDKPLENFEIHPIQGFREAFFQAKRLCSSKDNIRETMTLINERKQPVLHSDYLRDRANLPMSECAIRLRQFLSDLTTNKDKMLQPGDRTKLRLFCGLSDALERLPSDDAFDEIETLGNEYLERYEEVREYYAIGQANLKKAIAAAVARPVISPLAVQATDYSPK